MKQRWAICLLAALAASSAKSESIVFHASAMENESKWSEFFDTNNAFDYIEIEVNILENSRRYGEIEITALAGVDGRENRPAKTLEFESLDKLNDKLSSTVGITISKDLLRQIRERPTLRFSSPIEVPRQTISRVAGRDYADNNGTVLISGATLIPRSGRSPVLVHANSVVRGKEEQWEYSFQSHGEVNNALHIDLTDEIFFGTRNFRIEINKESTDPRVERSDDASNGFYVVSTDTYEIPGCARIPRG